MSTRSRIPSAIEPYLRLPPEASLNLLTGTLGCSPNWFTARFMSPVLSQNQGQGIDGKEDASGEVGVVLVSWMRDVGFWKNEIRRAAGCDIFKSIEQDRFAFLDQILSQLEDSGTQVLAQLEQNITSAISKVQTKYEKVLLVLDTPDILLATASTTSQQLSHMIMKLRGLTYATVVVCLADQPLLYAAVQSTEGNATLPIEAETAAFVTQQAHASRMVMSVRELDTGAARDISGVLRITRGGAVTDLDDAEQDEVKETESLYLVQRDGNVKVFERGADR